MSIIDKNIKFVVENYDEILALQKIVKHTEKTYLTGSTNLLSRL